MAYVLAVASDQRLWQSDFIQHWVDAIARSLPAAAWKRLSAGFGGKGERLYDWALMELSKQDGWTLLFWCGAASKRSRSALTICATLPPEKMRLKRWSGWQANAGRSSIALRRL
jgi:hypothetical protein